MSATPPTELTVALHTADDKPITFTARRVAAGVWRHGAASAPYGEGEQPTQTAEIRGAGADPVVLDGAAWRDLEAFGRLSAFYEVVARDPGAGERLAQAIRDGASIDAVLPAEPADGGRGPRRRASRPAP